MLKNIVFAGFYPDGAKGKITTIKKLIRDTQAAAVTMQETKCQQTGRVNLDGFYTYEYVRNKKRRWCCSECTESANACVHK